MTSLYSDILLESTVHNDAEIYIRSGYGGKKIKNWPFYKFIKMWVNGNRKQARSKWIDWLLKEFNKYKLVPKSKGGMYHGSVHLYSLKFKNINKKNFLLDPSLICNNSIRKGASTLVDRRIQIIRSIVKNGYKIDLADPIFAIKKGKLYTLMGGHHRAAVLCVLGYKKLPRVIVYSKLLWEIRKCLIKIKFLNFLILKNIKIG